MAFPLIGALIAAGVSLASKGVSTAVNRNRATSAMSEQLYKQGKQSDLEYKRDLEAMESQFAKDNELAQSSLNRGAKALEEKERGFAFEKDAAERDQVETSLSGIQQKADQRKSRLFGKREDNVRRWGL